MDPYANMGCVLKISADCEACHTKVLEVVGSICGPYNISIDADRGTADISGQVDPHMLMNALAKAGQHAELLRVKLQNPCYSRNPYHGFGMTDMYGMASPYGSYYHQKPYPIHDPYWYSRNIHDPYHYSHHANYYHNYRRYPYRSTYSFGFAPIRHRCYHRLY